MTTINFAEQFKEAFPSLNIKTANTEVELKSYFTEKTKDKKVFVILTDGLVDNFAMNPFNRSNSEPTMSLNDKLVALVYICIRFQFYNAEKKGLFKDDSQAHTDSFQQFQDELEYALLTSNLGRDRSVTLTSVLNQFQYYQTIRKSNIGAEFAGRVDLVFTTLAANPTLINLRYGFQNKGLNNNNVLLYTGKKEFVRPTVFDDLDEFSNWSYAIQAWLDGEWIGNSLIA